jgi:hypothetical protein
VSVKTLFYVFLSQQEEVKIPMEKQGKDIKESFSLINRYKREQGYKNCGKQTNSTAFETENPFFPNK